MAPRTLFGRPVGSRATGAAAIVVVAVVVIMATTLIGQARPPAGASPSAAQASSTPAGSPEAAWAAVDLVDVPQAASLAAVAADDAGVRPDTAFTLTSLAGEPVTALAQRLEVSPVVELRVVTSAADGLSATLAPAEPLDPGRTYRMALRSPDGAFSGSWAFRVRGPVAVLGTIPGDATTEVPVTTGIEVTFNQDDVEDLAGHWSIAPATTGRFERHGRTQVFVPDRLLEATVYTVTISAGLGRTGTDLTLPGDVVFRFETDGPQVTEPRLGFGRDVVESGPDARPTAVVVSLGIDDYENPAAMPAEADVTVYRLASADVAADVLADFLRAPRWATYTDPLMPTNGLPVAMRFEASLEQLTGARSLLRLPDTLPKGWYIVELAGTRPAQAFLQVTPVSAWVAVLRDRTVAWVNDVTSGKPVTGATVALEGAASFARADVDGLAIGETPAALIPAGVAGDQSPAPSPVLRVTAPSGDLVLVPFDVAGEAFSYRGEWWEKTEPADQTYWSMLATDRDAYRSDDTIHAWGYLRARDGGGVPASVVLRLVPQGGDASDPPSLARATAQPGPDGTFSAALALQGAPTGAYEVEAVVDGRVVGARWLSVDIIRKPPYRLEMTSDHLAVISGTPVAWTVGAEFFDGTPAPGLGIEVTGPEGSTSQVTTGADGVARFTVAATIGDGWPREDAGGFVLSAAPEAPEAAEIWAEADVLTFPTSVLLDASGTVANRRLRVTGTLHAVDLAKTEKAIAAGTWEGDAAGKPVGGSDISAVITEYIPVRRQTGTSYDFVEKRVVPVYDYSTEERAVEGTVVRSRADGTFAFTVPVPSSTHQYRVVLRTTDPEGRLQQQTFYAGQVTDAWAGDEGIVFQIPSDVPGEMPAYGVGDRIAWPMTDAGRTLPTGGGNRYLYLVAQRGLRGADVTDEPVFTRTVGAADAPGIFVMGIRFTGSTYAPKAAAWADFDARERELTVTVTADRSAYRPGDPLTLDIRTARRDGEPVAAAVVVQAVDEKLYAMGLVETPDPLPALYGRVDSGVVRLTATHQAPTNAGPEGEGDTGGGDGDAPRTDFRDTLLFREVRTDARGRATLTVNLSDDLTSWHVAAMAFTSGVEAGVGELLVPVGLPFFVEATVADTYLVADRPTIRLRAYGDALRAGDAVEFTVSSTSLGMPATKVTGTAFTAVSVPLPALRLGEQALDIAARTTARTGSDGKPLADRLIARFDVIRSRLTAAESAWLVAGDPLPAVPTDAGLATYTFSDAGRSRFVPLLEELADAASVRVDRSLARARARDLLITVYGRDPATLPPGEVDLDRWPLGTEEDELYGTVLAAGLALVPWGGVDPWAAVDAALFAPDAFANRELVEVLEAVRDMPSSERDLRIGATAALAGLGEPVLDLLQAAAREPDLSDTERLYLALGLAAAGDQPGALRIERELLGAHGERLGAWVRLHVGTTPDDTLDATARLAVVAASVGDPLAEDLAAYVVANPGHASTQALQLVAYVARAIERAPATAAAFAYTVDGTRTVVRLDAGDSETIVLGPAQRSTLRVEPVTGRTGIAVSWRAPVSADALVAHPDLALTRSAPAAVEVGQIVVVTLTPRLGEAAIDGCYEVVEQVPSGLAPLVGDWGETDVGVLGPWSVSGQEVRWCAWREGRIGALQYRARIVSEGTYAWEPAVMQHESAPELLAKTPAGTVTIRTP